jgi:hypothetical protein
VGNLSAGTSFATASRIEDLARVGNLADAPDALDALGDELDRLRPALRALVAVRMPDKNAPAPEAQ